MALSHSITDKKKGSEPVMFYIAYARTPGKKGPRAQSRPTQEAPAAQSQPARLIRRQATPATTRFGTPRR